MKNCRDCAHGIFDERFGEWKCAIVQHKIYNVDRLVACKDYIHKKKVYTEKTDVEKD